MTHLTILKPGVEFYDDGHLQRPGQGEVVAVLSSSVVRSLVKAGRAVEGRTSPVVPAENAPEAAGSPEAADRPHRDDDTRRPEVGAEKLSWRDVDGISKPSLDLLEKNAAGESPLEATSDDLLRWLEGSTRRHALVDQALVRWKAARSTGGGEGA